MNTVVDKHGNGLGVGDTIALTEGIPFSAPADYVGAVGTIIRDNGYTFNVELHDGKVFICSKTQADTLVKLDLKN